MKVFSALFIGFSFLFLTSCESAWPKDDLDLTECIQAKAESPADNGDTYKYVYKYVKKDGQGVTQKLVYFRFVTSNEATDYDELYDKACNLVCEPQRGVYSGLTGDCAYPMFNDPQEWTLIWTNPKLKKN